MTWVLDNWEFLVQCLSFVMNCVTALILYVKTRDVKYLKNLCPPKVEELPKEEIPSSAPEQQKPEVYLSVSKLKEILTELEDDDNGSSQ